MTHMIMDEERIYKPPLVLNTFSFQYHVVSAKMLFFFYFFFLIFGVSQHLT